MGAALGADAVVKPSLFIVLLVLSGQARGADGASGDCVGEGQAIEVKVGAVPPAVCVGASSSVVLEFESPIIGERTVADGGVEPFPGLGGKSIAFMASGMAEGARGRVTVYFADGFEPESATFPVVVVPGPTQPRVKVLRQPRTAASLREEVEKLMRRLAVCQSGDGQLPTVSAPPGALPGLLALDAAGAPSLPWRIVTDFVVRPGLDISVKEVKTFLFPGSGGGAEAAVNVQLKSGDSDEWAVEEAVLLSNSGEALARVRTLTPFVMEPRDTREVVVVSEPTTRATPGKYTLKLRGRGRELVLENVTFK